MEDLIRSVNAHTDSTKTDILVADQLAFLSGVDDLFPEIITEGIKNSTTVDMKLMLTTEYKYHVNKVMLAKAYEKGLEAGKASEVDTRKDSHGNFMFPEKTITSLLGNNPYNVTGSGKKLKSAWHNGFLAGINFEGE